MASNSIKARIQSFNTREANARAAQAFQHGRPIAPTRIPKFPAKPETHPEQAKATKPDHKNDTTIQHPHHYLHEHPSLRGKICPHVGDRSAKQGGEGKPSEPFVVGAKRRGQGSESSPWGFWSHMKAENNPRLAEMCNQCRAEAGLEPLADSAAVPVAVLKGPISAPGLSISSQCLDVTTLSSAGVTKTPQAEVPHGANEQGKSTANANRSFIPLSPNTTLSSSTRNMLSMDMFREKEAGAISDFVSVQFKEKVHDALFNDLTKINRMLDGIILDHSVKLQEVTAKLSLELSRLSVDIDSANVDVSKERFPEPHRSIAQMTPQLHAQSDSFHALIKLVEAAADSWRSDPEGKSSTRGQTVAVASPEGHQPPQTPHQDDQSKKGVSQTRSELQVPVFQAGFTGDYEGSTTYHSTLATACQSPVISAEVTTVANSTTGEVGSKMSDAKVADQATTLSAMPHGADAVPVKVETLIVAAPVTVVVDQTSASAMADLQHTKPADVPTEHGAMPAALTAIPVEGAVHGGGVSNEHDGGSPPPEHASEKTG